ncbi:MAG: ABC transporter permease subunit [Armatimonadetes bacterium]|nr:ABC transporter permease subunit [Akkermansiaceae bacterium]
MKSEKPSSPDPKRFEVSRATLWFDRFMGWAIRLGGIGVILAVFGIFYFIGKEVIPLFKPGAVVRTSSVQSEGKPLILGVDEWGELPFFYSGGENLLFVDGKSGTRTEFEVPGLDGLNVTASSYDPVNRRVSIGLEDGRVGSFLINYRRVFENGEAKGVEPSVVVEPWYEIKAGTGPVTALSYGDGGDSRVIVVKRDDGVTQAVSIVRLGFKGGLIGGKKLSILGEMDISPLIEGKAVLLRASQNGRLVLIADEKHAVSYFLAETDGVSKRQAFSPFNGGKIAQMDFLFGGVSAILTSEKGTQQQWSLFRTGENTERLFGPTKDFPNVGDGRKIFAKSQRNRTFLAGAGRELSIRHSTSGAVRWHGTVDLEPAAAILDAKGESFWIASETGEAKKFEIKDRHPDAGWQAFFGEVWYEGGKGPVYQWQSTGGSDDFEAKLSLVPLIFGSLKGTAYALLFSIPIALLAAIFSAAFLPPDVKRIVKPTMEIMSSLPSVVLGFLAGLWLAPILDTRVPSVMMMVILIPLTALLVGYLWCRMPLSFRNRFEGGAEWMMVIPFLALAGMIGWWSGPLIEKMFFVYTDPGSGLKIADFSLWWPQATGTKFEQRNSLVLGFIMGFAVIPVIFTIAEDALSNVPKSLTAAAAALGANRWQVVRTVMLPVASSGIFSALMIGFGRAVGETMVMVMATGNTPIMEWNLFSGMRTLAANIAVELPEAPVGSTHYRTLFLGAVVLFAMTFVMNTIAEILRQRLREKNKLV